jgi:hypothetical protein
MDRKELVESSLRIGAGLSASGIAFLGGLGIGPAEAMPTSVASPNAPEHIDQIDKDTPPRYVYPKGVRFLDGRSEIAVEAQQAFSNLTERWTGSVVVHAPTKIKGAVVNFAQSPNALLSIRPGMGFHAQEQQGAIVVTGGGIERFKKREYLVILDPQTSKFGYLDLNWAIKAGAVDFKQIKGEAPKTKPYSTMEDKPPSVVMVSDKSFRKEGVHFVLDVNGRIRPVEPSQARPRA